MTNTIAGPTSVPDFIEEIDRQANNKRDFVIDQRSVQLDTDKDGSLMTLQGVEGSFPVKDNAHDQLATFLNVPKGYYDRMRKDQPGLLDQNVNTWLGSDDKKRLIRVLDGKARAVLSDRYRRIDNDLVAKTVLETARNHGIDVRHTMLTEERMYIKLTFPGIQGEVRGIGDIVQLGVRVANSEIGKGKASVTPSTLTLSCLNGATHENVLDDFGVSRTHLGSRLNGDENGKAHEIYSDETMEADDATLMLKIRDTIRAAADGRLLERIIADMRKATEVDIERPADAVVELAQRKSFTEIEQDAVLQHFLRDKDFTQYGLAQAVTRAAQDLGTYDRSDEFEKFGGDILAMARAEFTPIATADFSGVATKTRRRGRR